MTGDTQIRLLPLHVANKIAAGEVVERPASVLKELLENAIDAGASRIEVTVNAGGRKLIAVRDNGSGMSREDALLSLERQATSKIRDVDDIERISTLGFRGEAIPSIASVSRFTLSTRRANAEEGTRLSVNAGTLAEVCACGVPPGTSVEVRDLFCNVPARRKFLRAYATEEGHIKATFTVHALAHPTIGFALTVDGREVYRFAPSGTLAERLRDFYGDQFIEALIPVDATSPDGIRIHGFVERPSMNLSTRHNQYVFINGRPATAAAIGYALREAYPKRNAEASHPAVILFIELDPTQVDVNVHPAKREVRFRRPAMVREAVIGAVTGAFHRDSPAPAIVEGPAALAGYDVPPAFSVPFQPSLPRVDDFKAKDDFPMPVIARNGDGPFTGSGDDTAGKTGTDENANPASPVDEDANARAGGVASSSPWRYFNFLAITESGYILIETDIGIVTINPLAARERIVYERLLDQNETTSQPLLIPETVKLGPLESARIRDFLDVLEAQGFAVEEFGNDTWKIDAVPQIIGGDSAAALLATIAHDLAEGGAKRGGVRWRDELVAKSVARSFAGAAEKLTNESAEKLILALANCRNPYVSPRGRAVMIFTSLSDLKRKFS